MNSAVSGIRYMKRSEIDANRWDECIRQATNGLIYARSLYLDTISKNWSALVLDDYRMVMPLTWKKKFGFTYLYQPAFTSQLGIFFSQSVEKSIIENFIEQAKRHFKFCEIHLNFENTLAGLPLRTNYILDLNRTYAEIYKGYKKRLLENLSESEPHHLIYQDAVDYQSTVELFRHQYGKRMPHVKQNDYRRFANLCQGLIPDDMIFARQVKDRAGNLLNSSIFFRDERRIYNIMSVSLPEGRAKRAHFFLLDQLIKEFSNSNRYLDLEGSEVPGIAEFYRKFGTVNQPYSFLRYNHLPFPFRLFK